MGKLVCARLELALHAYSTENFDLAITVWQADRAIDDQYESILSNLLAGMIRSSRFITQCAHLLFVVKNLERIGDYAVNIADIAHYVATGEEIKGERPKGDCVAAVCATG